VVSPRGPGQPPPSGESPAAGQAPAEWLVNLFRRARIKLTNNPSAAELSVIVLPGPEQTH